MSSTKDLLILDGDCGYRCNRLANFMDRLVQMCMGVFFLRSAKENLLKQKIY